MCTLTLPMSQLQTHRLMTPYVRSRIEYLIPTENVSVSLIRWYLTRRGESSLIDGFSLRFNENSEMAYLLWDNLVYCHEYFYIRILLQNKNKPAEKTTKHVYADTHDADSVSDNARIPRMYRFLQFAAVKNRQ